MFLYDVHIDGISIRRDGAKFLVLAPYIRSKKSEVNVRSLIAIFFNGEDKTSAPTLIRPL